MAVDSHPGPKPAAAAAVAAPQPPRPSPLAANPALRMLGLPSLPRKLPSRNWTIFWAVTGAFTAAVVYDKREKKRATARWRRAVQPLAAEPIASASQLPRKLTIYLEAPPGDGLRAAQDHFFEYVKPVLAASGLDWDFVQGRQQGDVRAAVAEKIRRARMAYERPGQELPKTDEAIVEDIRTKIGVPRYEGPMGDIVIGRHTWKEYVRGLHEGWLGPLDLPPRGDEATADQSAAVDGHAAAPAQDGDGAEEKPRRPRQPPPYNAPRDYAAASLPALVPDEFAPSSAIPFPHRLGFSQTPVRLARFLNRRKLADHIGREVAAVCWAASREWRDADGQYEQQLVLAHEEADWPKSVWKTDDTVAQSPPPAGDLVWPSPVAVDARIAQRMRRFQIRPDDAQSAAAIAVPEEDVEGWIKGSLRSLWRWSARSFESRPEGPKVGDLDDS